MSLPQKLPLDLMQTRWASEINPILANPICNGILLKDIQLTNGVTTVNHLLGRKQQGWIIFDIDAAANIFRSEPLNGLTLTLTSDADAVVSLYVF